MKKAEQFYREAMAKHGLANAVSPMIKDIVFDIVEKMEKENLSEIKELQDKIDLHNLIHKQKMVLEPDFEMVVDPTMDEIRHLGRSRGVTFVVPYDGDFEEPEM